MLRDGNDVETQVDDGLRERLCQNGEVILLTGAGQELQYVGSLQVDVPEVPTTETYETVPQRRLIGEDVDRLSLSERSATEHHCQDCDEDALAHAPPP